MEIGAEERFGRNATVVMTKEWQVERRGIVKPVMCETFLGALTGSGVARKGNTHLALVSEDPK